MRNARPLVGEAQRPLGMNLLDDEQLASGVRRLVQIACALGDAHLPAALIALDAIEIAQRILVERDGVRGDRAQAARRRGRSIHRLVTIFGAMERLRKAEIAGAGGGGFTADPADLHRKAAEVRAAAAACHDAFANHELQKIAARFERLARRLENWRPLPPVPAVHGKGVAA